MRTMELVVGLVQINNGYTGQYYLPYSVAMLEAYARKNLSRPDRYRFLVPIYRREPVADAVAKLLGADIVGFSIYVWNEQLSLAIARELKRQKPEVLVVFGGPQVPDHPERFMGKNPFIDIACHGEGERVFCALLERWEDKEHIPAISYRNKGQLVRNPRVPRVENLNDFPSPYLDGILDPLMRENPNGRWNAIWETNRGCPFSCTFCDWGSAVNATKVRKWEEERLFREIEWFAEREVDFIFGADANFGIFERDIGIAKRLADSRRRTGFPRAFSVSSTKNATERSFAAQKILSDAGLNTGVTVSMQSMDVGTLVAIKRDNIQLDGPKGFKELQRKFTLAGIQTSTDLVLGLPGETYESFVRGVSELIANGQHNRILFFNLTVLPNAEMGDPEYQKKYGMETVETRIITIHGNLHDKEDEVAELQQLVVATSTMPREDWVRVRAFSWMTAFLHFDKVLQIPLVVVHELTGIDYRTLIEFFSDARFGSEEAFPILSKIRKFFVRKAEEIQGGAEEFCRAPQWLDLWWPTDEYMLIELATSGDRLAFYEEAERALSALLVERGMGSCCGILHEAVHLNERIFKMPFQNEDRRVELSHNLWEFYYAAICGRPIPLEEKSTVVTVDCTTERWDSWDGWCRFAVWYASHPGAFFFGLTPDEKQIAGHW